MVKREKPSGERQLKEKIPQREAIRRRIKMSPQTRRTKARS